MRAEDPATLTADYARLASQLGLPEKDLADQQAIAAAVRSWLGHHPGWLLILDNARNAADCRDHLPMGASGHVLITSRDPNWGSVGEASPASRSAARGGGRVSAKALRAG